MQRSIVWLLTAAMATQYGTLSSTTLQAQYLPAVEPLTPASDHHLEDHSRHNHSGRDLHEINLSEANLIGTEFSRRGLNDFYVGSNLADAQLALKQAKADLFWRFKTRGSSARTAIRSVGDRRRTFEFYFGHESVIFLGKV